MSRKTKKKWAPCAKRGCRTKRDGRHLLCHTHWREERDKDQSYPRCEWEGCDKAAESNGLCHGHALLPPPLDHPDRPLCAVVYCGNLVTVGDLGGGLCQEDHREWLLTGAVETPTGTPPPLQRTLRNRRRDDRSEWLVYAPFHPLAHPSDGWLYESRLNAHSAGKFAAYPELQWRYFVVRNIDHNPLNNDPINLAVMTVGAHSALHAAEERADKLAAEELAAAAEELTITA